MGEIERFDMIFTLTLSCVFYNVSSNSSETVDILHLGSDRFRSCQAALIHEHTQTDHTK